MVHLQNSNSCGGTLVHPTDHGLCDGFSLWALCTSSASLRSLCMFWRWLDLPSGAFLHLLHLHAGYTLALATGYSRHAAVAQSLSHTLLGLSQQCLCPLMTCSHASNCAQCLFSCVNSMLCLKMGCCNGAAVHHQVYLGTRTYSRALLCIARNHGKAPYFLWCNICI